MNPSFLNKKKKQYAEKYSWKSVEKKLVPVNNMTVCINAACW